MNPQDKEDLRRAVRTYLAERPALAFHEGMIHGHVSRQVACTVPEVIGACELLLDLGQIKEITNQMGSLRYFRIHAEGTLAHERSQ